MSSFGNQWRVIRHYLSMANFNTEVDKLVKKIKPATPEQWSNLVQKFEDIVKSKIMSANTTKEKSEEQTKQVESKVTSGHRTDILSNTGNTNKNDGDKNIVSLEKSNQDGNISLESETKEISIQSLLQGILLRKDLHFGKISEQKSWKTNKPMVSKTSIHSRTAYVISAIVTAETGESLLRRVQHFIEHLKQFPEARDYAIKEGGVRTLLRVQKSTRVTDALTKDILATVNEALALMGHTGPPKGAGPNILSIDGGGIRGIIAIEILKHLERLTGKRVIDMFDYIVGVSTGAIIAAVLASGAGDLNTATDMYHTLSKKMFGNTSIIGGTSRLVWSHSYYDTEAWENILRDYLNTITLTQCNHFNTPKMALVSCVVNAGHRMTPFLFRTYEPGYRVRSVFPGTSDALLWQAVRASAAAPTYFNEFKLNGLLHQDGGIMVNNPSAVGIHEARLLYGPSAINKACLISLGTGKALSSHADYQMMGVGNTGKEANSTSWKDKFNKILDSATDTEGVHLVLNDLLPPGNYFRFNPPLMQECAMDEIDPERINNVIVDTQSYIRRNKHKMSRAAQKLTAGRSITQKCGDFIQYQCNIMGIKTE